jgi:hypothetical protein
MQKSVTRRPRLRRMPETKGAEANHFPAQNPAVITDRIRHPRRASCRSDCAISNWQAMNMSPNRKPAFLDSRAADTAFLMKWTEETRLCAIIDSEQASTEEKYQALLDLAYLSGVLVSDFTDASESPQPIPAPFAA